MIGYFAGYFYEQLGDTSSASIWYKTAQKSPSDYCFPSRLEEVLALRAAINFNPEDAKKYFGVISACGSAGAWIGSQSVYFFLSDLPVIAMLLASLALAGAVFFS